ncbi:MAG: hypothetical protein H6707_20075 [Deltaproteobacteria bacterium]|nr:hypothetical protein [Deltaproteobacteria bacterium]
MHNGTIGALRSPGIVTLALWATLVGGCLWSRDNPYDGRDASPPSDGAPRDSTGGDGPADGRAPDRLREDGAAQNDLLRDGLVVVADGPTPVADGPTPVVDASSDASCPRNFTVSYRSGDRCANNEYLLAANVSCGSGLLLQNYPTTSQWIALCTTTTSLEGVWCYSGKTPSLVIANATTASCPAGRQRLTGGCGCKQPMFGLLEMSYPNGTDRWRCRCAQADINDVTVAVCNDDPCLPAVRIESVSQSIYPGTKLTVSAPCPTSHELIGGGCSIYNLNASGVYDSRGASGAWSCGFSRANSSGSLPATVTAYALCLLR